MGNYSGVDLTIPTATLELPSEAEILKNQEIFSMWQDLQTWLCGHLGKQCAGQAITGTNDSAGFRAENALPNQ